MLSDVLNVSASDAVDIAMVEKTPLKGLSSRSRPMLTVASRAPPWAAVLSSMVALTDNAVPAVSVVSVDSPLI